MVVASGIGCLYIKFDGEILRGAEMKSRIIRVGSMILSIFTIKERKSSFKSQRLLQMSAAIPFILVFVNEFLEMTRIYQ